MARANRHCTNIAKNPVADNPQPRRTFEIVLALANGTGFSGMALSASRRRDAGVGSFRANGRDEILMVS